MRVGVEVGGTFTDMVTVDGGRITITKVPSTPSAPERGALAAVGDRAAGIADLVHGSTVATSDPRAEGRPHRLRRHPRLPRPAVPATP